MRPAAKGEDRRSRSVLVSSCYKISGNKTASSSTVLIEHCCLMTSGNRWDIVVKCRPLPSCCNHLPSMWRDVAEVYPDAKVEQKHNDIEVTLPSLSENVEVAAFGTPGEDDQIRMQMAVFGKRPPHGSDWRIRIYLLHDTVTAFKQVCKKEKEMGNRLLTALAGLFVSNSNEDVRIEFTALESGWKIKEGKVKTIKSKDAWNSPENSNFPRRDFVISHVDKTKQQFFCEITASHGNDSASKELVALFEQTRRNDANQPPKIFKKPKSATTIYDLLELLTGSGMRRQMIKGV